MAFDTPTRNRLNKFVGDARALLTEEFTNQFKKDYGLDPDTGEVAELDRLSQLSDAQLQTAVILRDTLSHYRAGLPKANKDAAKDNSVLIERIIREQAFTILNRLCAIRMAEARDLVIESIAAGVQSKGFQLYQHVVGSSLGETGAAYRQFLFSLFDEFAVDLPVLFDRFSPQGRLFPRETVLLKLLEEINHAEIDGLWAEDETIGWVYQYFNSKEERKAMRDASQAPRNSRELAVRNQFFTPRYVVEFLTDNTLGRIWHEMRKGETSLTDACTYLVRRPSEIFLDEGQEAPEATDDDPPADLTQEELLNQPVHIPHRPLKDPREIRMLDPACGSMHFGLYAFDLYLNIYEEAWDIQSQQTEIDNPADNWHSFASFAGTYADKASFLRDVPRLIIEHNIHGIDIDPRAVQIAGLSLWLRAQRAWKSQGIAAGDRPQVTRSNIVCAEPMPGDQQQLAAFCQQLHPAIAQMVTAIFEEMRLAGEAGSLLKIEQEIKTLVAAARQQFIDNPPDKKTQMQLFGGAEVVKEQQLEFDLSGITDQQFFEQAEETIYEALRKYASETSEGGFRRKLFAGDAEKGFAFIELCRKRFEVVLMNPPFGAETTKIRKFLESSYENSKMDLLASFVKRGVDLMFRHGRLGAITSRTGLFLETFKSWRETTLTKKSSVENLADLGFGILDAVVEVAVYTIQKSRLPGKFHSFRGTRYVDKETELLNDVRRLESGVPSDSLRVSDQELLGGLPTSSFAYWVPEEVLRIFQRRESFGAGFGNARKGISTADNFRFLRLAWEAPENDVAVTRAETESGKRWIYFPKGGEYSPFYDDVHLVVNWLDDGYEIRNFVDTKGKLLAVPRNTHEFFRAGLTYPYRTTSGFNLRVMTSGSGFSDGGQAVLLKEDTDTRENRLATLGYFNTRIAQSFIEISLGEGDAVSSGSAARNYVTGCIESSPAFSDQVDTGSVAQRVEACVNRTRIAFAVDETTREFHAPVLNSTGNITQDFLDARSRELDSWLETVSDMTRVDEIFTQDFSIGAAGNEFLRDEFGDVLEDLDDEDVSHEEAAELLELGIEELIAKAREIVGPRRYVVKKLYWGSRRLELMCRILGCTPKRLVNAIQNVLTSSIVSDKQLAILSWAVGVSFGRFDQNFVSSEPKLDDVFSPLPLLPPACSSEKATIGIQVEGESGGILSRVQDVIEAHWGSDGWSNIVAGISGSNSDINKWFQNKFFEYHLGCYSKSRRQAPIYWPISTESGSYTLWFYYHRLTDQTLYKAVNDFVDPKLKQTLRQLADLRAIKDRTSSQEKELAQLTELESELEQFKADLLEIAAFWKPNLNDGVQITAAPLWKFFRLTKWRNKLKKTWSELESGKYDWAHLALSIWPDRVVREKCTTDRSIAIAHDLEEKLWEEREVTKVSKTGRETKKMQWMPKELSDTALDAIVSAVKSGNHSLNSIQNPAKKPN